MFTFKLSEILTEDHLTSYGYNEFNKVSSITNALNQTIQLGYDKNGNTTKIIFPKGNTLSYTFNPLNRLDGIYYDGIKQWDLAYDASGNLTSVKDSAGKTKRLSYDKNSRLTQVAEGSSMGNLTNSLKAQKRILSLLTGSPVLASGLYS